MTNILKIFLFLGLTFVNSFSQNISITVDSNSIDESASSVMTLTTDAVSESDIRLPLTISGTATEVNDYTTNFASKGEETSVASLNDNYNYYGLLADGRSVLLNGNNLLVYNPDSGQPVTVSLSRSYSYFQVSGNLIYSVSNNALSNSEQSLYKIDISDLSAVTETSIIDTDDNHYFEYEFSVEGDNILYNERDSDNNVYRIYKKEGTSDPELLITLSSNYWGLRSILVNDKAYLLFYYDTVYEIVDGALVTQPQLQDSDGNNIQVDENWVNVHDEKVYARSIYPNSTDGYQIYRVDLSTGVSEILPYVLGSDISVIKDFSVDSAGDLYLYTSTNSGNYGIFKYQLSPQLKILAGETTGTVTFASVDDSNDELTETIIITPGTPSNATLADSSAITVSIEDNDDAPEVTLSLSATSLIENSSNTVTLTATPDVVSEQEITLTYSLTNSTAGADEYSVSAETLVIPAGASSASLTVSSSEDDNLVEPTETIVFDFTAPDNATFATDGSSVTINLLSEDNPAITSIAGSPETIIEGTSSTVTMTIESASSNDVVVPLTITGTATGETDYTTSFASLSQESLVYYLTGESAITTSSLNSDSFSILEDGRHAFLNGSTLTLVDPEISVTYTVSLANSYNSTLEIVGNKIYAKNSNRISEIIVDSAGNLTSETILVSTSEVSGAITLPQNQTITANNIAMSGNDLYYMTYHGITGVRFVYKQDITDIQTTSDLLDSGSDISFNYLFYANNILYASNSSSMYKYQAGEFQYYTSSNYYPYKILDINDKVFIKYQTNNAYKYGELNLTNGSIDEIQVTYGSTIFSTQGFYLDQNGDIFLYNQETEGDYGIFKYQLSPQLKILAGETEGTVTFTSVDDSNDELTETIIITPGTPSNATLADSSAITVSIEDNDDGPEVTLSLSATSLSENSSNTVTLTATPDVVSEQEITLTYSLTNSTAGADEYSVSAETLVIPAGASSASLTVSSSEDDNLVELTETIVFDFTAPDNATFATDGSSVTINLLSEDNPAITSIAGSPETFTEGTSSTVTMTIESASSNDVVVPLTITGTATGETDYTTSFASEGEEFLAYTPTQSNFGEFSTLPNGKYLFVNGNSVRIYDPVTQTLSVNNSVRNYGNHTVHSTQNTFYATSGGDELWKINISENNTIDETLHVEAPSGYQFDSSVSLEGNKLFYILYSNNTYVGYTKQGDQDPVQIYQTGDCCWKPVLVDDRLILIRWDYWNEMTENENGVFSYDGNNNYPSTIDGQSVQGTSIDYSNRVRVHNNEVYVNASFTGIGYKIYKLDLENNEFISINYTTSEDMANSANYFDFDNNGNLLVYSNIDDNIRKVYSYQLSPQISIAAGETEGTVTFTSVDDSNDELTETIIITPGTPSNATLADSSAITVSIEDNDDGPEVTLSLSATSLSENSSNTVTLTATPDVVSEQEITLTYSLTNSTAGADEYSVSAETLVIPAGASSASLTVSSSEDDNLVEPTETIVFDFTAPDNATFATDGSSVTINLLSEDEPESTLVATLEEFTEGQTTDISISIDEPSSFEVIVPLELSGAALFNIDYSTDFDTEGRETTMISPKNNQGFGDNFEVLNNGSYIFLEGNRIYYSNPELSGQFETFYLQGLVGQGDGEGYSSRYYSYMTLVENTIYLQSSSYLEKIDVSDLSATENNIIYVETHVELDPENANDAFYGRFHSEGNTLIYQIRVANNEYVTYTKQGDENPVEIYSGNSYFQTLFLFNGRTYYSNSNNIYEIYNGSITNSIGYNNTYFYQMKAYNGIAYFLIDNYSNNTREIHQIDIENEIVDANSGNLGSSTIVNYELGSSINYVRNFAFDSAGNIVLHNRTDPSNYYGIFSYQLSPQITIPAGSTEGTFSFTAIDDLSYELTEDIIITPGQPGNATISNTEPLNIDILDNDDAPIISFELSDDNIYENSEISVTLTATVNIQSGVEITIPFTMDGSADYVVGDPDSSEYSVRKTGTDIETSEIVISPNSTSANITIYTYGFDDNVVEMAESIIFNFTDVQLGDTGASGALEQETATLNLISEDLAEINNTTVESNELTEGDVTTIQVTINSPTSEDIYVPIAFSGTAEINSDFIVNTGFEGEETLIGQLSSNEISKYGILADGRHVILNSSQLTIIAPDASYQNTASLDTNYWYMDIEDNTIYLANNDRIAIVDLTDISANQVEVEEIVSLSSLNISMNGYNFTVENGRVVFGVSASGSGTRQVWSLGNLDSEPELLGSNLNCCYKPQLYNGDIYRLETWGYQTPLVDGVEGETINYSGHTNAIDRGRQIIVRNGIMYGFAYSQNSGDLVQIDLEAGNGITSKVQNVDIGESINNTRFFGFDPEGNVVLVNEVLDDDQLVSQLNSYSLSAEIKIPAGETEGSIEVITIDDDSFEDTEQINVTIQTPSNALINENYEFEIQIFDNDEAPSISFELSSETIVEDSDTDVTLTATLSEVTSFETTIPFTLDGTADYFEGDSDTSEYSISANSIVIPPNTESANISISTDGFDDLSVEILETIIFNFGEIQVGLAATVVADPASITLNLESDDDPIITSLSVDPVEFAEHEFTTITAEISEPSSRDLTISIGLAGTAELDIDYNAVQDALGEESRFTDLSSDIRQIDFLDDGRMIMLKNYSNLHIYETDGTITNIPLEYNATRFIVSGNDIILRDWQQISKYNILTEETSLLTTQFTNSNVQHREHFDYVNGKLFYATYDYNQNLFSVYSREGNEEATLLCSIYSNTYDNMIVDENETVRFYNGDNIYEIVSETEISSIGYISGLNGGTSKVKKYNNKTYILSYAWNGPPQVYLINEPTDDEGPLSNYFIAEQIPYQIEGNVNTQTINDFAFNGGDIYLYIQDNGTSTYYINQYNLAPRIKIFAGESEGTLILNGIEDDLNAPGEETDETIDITFGSIENGSIDESLTATELQATILNNEISFTLVGTSELDVIADEENSFLGIPSLSNSSIDWGDFDRDGDQDFAVMGYSAFFGSVTRVYRNENGVFVNHNAGLDGRVLGQVKWIDYNKDGYIDLIVSGLDVNEQPSTTIYKNIDGQIFTPSIELTLPNLFETSMDSGDLDNDGDIDFVINGRNVDNQWKKYIFMREGDFLVQAENSNVDSFSENGFDGIIKIVDIHTDGDQDIIGVGDGPLFKVNTLIKDNNDFYNYSWNHLNNPALEVFDQTIYYMGERDNNYQIWTSDINSGYSSQYLVENVEGLEFGDIAIGDYDNDGSPDLLVNGESDTADAETHLYNISGDGRYVENTEITFPGFRNSTAKWVDYDNDGDLDLFLSGTTANGEATQLYRNNLINKVNMPAAPITNLQFEDLGNGRVNLSWDTPEDDFSNNLSYVVRLGTTPGGSELSNTLSNLQSGERLITDSPDIYTNNYEVLLSPGNYYWSVQSVDQGLKGSEFSEEQTFQLTYEWKLLNQGGIIDRTIAALDNPIVKLTDIDADNDMDLVYGSSSGSIMSIYRLGEKRFDYFDQLNNSYNVEDVKFIDLNGDFVQDIIVSGFFGQGETGFRVYTSTSSGSFNETFSAEGLAFAKIKFTDINNDGIQEIAHIGQTADSGLSSLKVNIYEQNGNSLIGPLDISDQFSNLKNGAFDFGNVDQDNDIDFAITGSGPQGIQNKVYLNETIFTETVAPIFTESNIDLPPSFEPSGQSTLDFIDFDNDGDLDIAITGTGFEGAMFKILVNNGLTGEALEFTELPNNGLSPIRNAKIEFGDFNGDGYSDILYSGSVSGEGEVSKLSEYNPDTQSYVDSDFDLEGIINASVAFGDMDGDNDLDFAISGESSTDNSVNILKTYLNVRNESADVIASNPGSDFGPSIVADGIIDTSDEFIVNEKPSTPEGLYTNQLGFDSETNTYEIEFGWESSQDDHTPSEGLTYALKVGTTSSGSQIMKVNAMPNGYRQTAGKGNVEHSIKWSLNLPQDTYYWSVQAIDASYAGSAFSETEEFSTYEAPALVAEYNLDLNDVTIGVETENFELGDSDTGDGYWSYSVDGAESIFVSGGDTELVLPNLPNGEYTVLISLVDNDGAALVPPTEQTINFTVLVTPALNASVDTVENIATVDVDVEEFKIGTTETSDGYWTYSLNGADAVSVYTIDDLVLTDLPNGDHTILISLVDNNGAALEPAIDQTIEFTTYISPTLEATVSTFENQATVSVTTENFTVGDGTAGDGYWTYSLNGADAVSVYTTDDLVLTDLPNGDHTILISLVDNNGAALDPAIEQTIEFTTYLAPILQSSVSVTDDQATISISTENFTVGDGITGDGYWTYSLNGADAVSVYTTDDLVLTDLPNGEHTILISLVDNNGAALDPTIETTLTFSTYVTPTITASVVVDGADATFTVETTNNDDGDWSYSLNGGDTVIVYATELELTDLPNGDHTILISLVDNTGAPLDPVIEQTLTFSTFNGMAECGETVVYSQVSNGDYNVSLSSGDDLMASVTINADMESTYDFLYVRDGTGNLLNPEETTGVLTNLTYYSSDGVISVQVVNDESIENGDVTLAFECVSLSISENDPLYMRIYPNPTNGDFVTIQTPLNGVKHVDVFDITGKLLISKSLSADTLDVSSMSSGVYLVNITVNGYKKTVKLIIK